MKQKKIPMRRCNGCNEQKPKNELVRIVKNSDGDVSLDLKGKMPGRGAYICRSEVCLSRVRKSRRIDRIFEMTVPDSVWEQMEEAIKSNDD